MDLPLAKTCKICVSLSTKPLDFLPAPQNLGNYGPLKSREFHSLDRLQKQAVVLQQLLDVADAGPQVDLHAGQLYTFDISMSRSGNMAFKKILEERKCTMWMKWINWVLSCQQIRIKLKAKNLKLYFTENTNVILLAILFPLSHIRYPIKMCRFKSLSL